METVPLLKSKFLHRFEREQQYCLYHSLTQQKVYGGPILDVLFRAFEKPRVVSDVIDTLGEAYPESAL